MLAGKALNKRYARQFIELTGDPKSYVKNNVVHMATALKSQSDTMIDMSIETAIDRNIKILKMTEEKVKMEGLKEIEIKISLVVGPVQIDLHKNVE